MILLGSMGSMWDFSKVQAPEVRRSAPVTESSAGTMGQPRGSVPQSPARVKYLA